MVSSTDAVAGRSSSIGLTLVRRKWSGHEVPNAGQPRVLGRGEEVEDDVAVGEVADHRLVGGREPADGGGDRRGLGPAFGLGERGVAVQCWSEGFGFRVFGDVGRGGVDDPQAVGLGLLRGLPPGGDAMPAEDAADRLGVGFLDRGDVEAELEARTPPRHPDDAVAVDLLGQRLAVGRGRDRDPGVGVQVVDVGGVDQAVHRGVDRRSRSALAVQAVVERRDHLVLALDTGVDAGQRTHPVQPQHRKTGLGQRAEVTAGALDPDQLDVLAGHRVDLGALGGGVAPGVVGVLGVAAQPVAPLDESGHGRVGGSHLSSSVSVVEVRGAPATSLDTTWS